MIYWNEVLFYGIPLAAFVFFIVSLVRYRQMKTAIESMSEPDQDSLQKLKTRKFLLIVASVIAGVFALVVIAFAVLLFLAVAFM